MIRVRVRVTYRVQPIRVRVNYIGSDLGKLWDALCALRNQLRGTWNNQT